MRAQKLTRILIASMDALDAGTTALLINTIEHQLRPLDREAHGAASGDETMADILQNAIQRRDDALSLAVATTQTVTDSLRQEGCIENDKMGSEKRACEEELKRVRHGLDDCRAEETSSVRYIAQQQQQVFEDADRCPVSRSGLYDTIGSLVETIALLRDADDSIEQRFLSAKLAFEAKLAAAVASAEAAELRTERLSKTVPELEKKLEESVVVAS